jgi:hypothetical protein
MLDYTLEEVIDFINGEIEDAYTEASKEEADELVRKGKEWRGYYPKFKKFGDKAIPKGDPETVRKKDIRHGAKIGNHIYDSHKKKAPGSHYYDHPTSSCITSGSSPYNKKYDEISQKEREIQDKIRKKAKDFQDKEGKEYEIYYGDKNDKEYAKDFIKKTRSEGKHPITADAYSKHAFYLDNPKYKESDKRERDAFRKLSVSNRLADKAKKGFKNKDVEAKWKKFVDKYEETVYDILEAYEYDVISYEDANDYLDMISLFED